MKRLTPIWLLLMLTLTVGAQSYTTDTTIYVCEGGAVVLMSPSAGESYMWMRNDAPYPRATRSVIDTAVVDTVTYICMVLDLNMVLGNNLMDGGDFESRTGFTSDYKYVANTPSYYSSHSGDYDLYTLTDNANTFWHDFAPVTPHEGNCFGLFDAGKNGYAWMAETANNPNLVLTGDSTYYFSYWAAYPNKSPGNSPAELQFVIRYTDPAGQQQTTNLGATYRLGTQQPLNDWFQQHVTWVAPCSSSDVMIGVYDRNNARSGNDFCLDGIVFQQATAAIFSIEAAHRFTLIAKDCSTPSDTTVTPPDTIVPPEPPGPCVGVPEYTKWNDVIFIPDPDGKYVTYQWFCNGQPIAGATRQFYYAPGGLQGVYHAVMQTRDGTTEQSCPAEFGALDRSADLNPGSRPSMAAERIIHVSDHVKIRVRIGADNTVIAEKLFTR